MFFEFQISDYLYYDEKRGYFLNSFLFQVSYNYSCEANKKNVYDSRNFTIYINSKLIMFIGNDLDLFDKRLYENAGYQISIFFYLFTYKLNFY